MKSIGKAAFALAAWMSMCSSVPPAAAETVKFGAIKALNPIYIAMEKGYFAAEGLTVEPVFFDTAQPISLAVVAGDIDFGVTAATAALYNLGGKGALRIIAGGIREVPRFQSTSYVVSNRAFAAGVTSFKDFAGHSVALPVLGSPPHYSLELLSEKYRFDLKSMQLLQLQSNPNQVSAVSGGQADTGLIQVTAVMPAIQRGDLKLLGWVGDETPWQLGLIIAGTKMTTENPDRIDRFLRAYKKGAHDYAAAFVGPNGARTDGAAAAEALAIESKYLGQPVDILKSGVAYYDPDLRLDTNDVLHQIDWYKRQGFVKDQVDGNALIDKRSAISLTEK
jgi:NitT/TauT family transport system substrate-binding protein